MSLMCSPPHWQRPSVSPFLLCARRRRRWSSSLPPFPPCRQRRREPRACRIGANRWIQVCGECGRRFGHLANRGEGSSFSIRSAYGVRANGWCSVALHLQSHGPHQRSFPGYQRANGYGPTGSSRYPGEDPVGSRRSSNACSRRDNAGQLPEHLNLIKIVQSRAAAPSVRCEPSGMILRQSWRYRRERLRI